MFFDFAISCPVVCSVTSPTVTCTHIQNCICVTYMSNPNPNPNFTDYKVLKTARFPVVRKIRAFIMMRVLNGDWQLYKINEII